MIEAVLFVTLGVVLVVLITGLLSLGHSDEAMHRQSNIWMRLRVISQGVAVALLAILVYLTRGGGTG